MSASDPKRTIGFGPLITDAGSGLPLPAPITALARWSFALNGHGMPGAAEILVESGANQSNGGTPVWAHHNFVALYFD